MANILLGYWYKLYTKQTKQEQKLEAEIAKMGARYRTQHPFIAQKAFADFYFPDYKLVVEVDDPGHMKPEQAEKDKKRTTALNALGITVIRFTNEDVDKRLSAVSAQIKDWLV